MRSNVRREKQCPYCDGRYLDLTAHKKRIHQKEIRGTDE